MYESTALHVYLIYEVVKFVEDGQLEVGRHHQVQSELVRKGDGCDLRVSLGDVNDLESALPLARLLAPEVDFFLSPRNVDLVVRVLYEIFHGPRVGRVLQLLPLGRASCRGRGLW